MAIGKRTERVSWIAALKEKEIFAPMTFTGTCNRDLFEMWLEKCLLPKLNPRDIIVIDNASFHKSQAIEDLIAQFGCELLDLPPYSPDFNPIAKRATKAVENCWFVLKNWMRQRWDEFDNFRDCVDAAFAACPNVSA